MKVLELFAGERCIGKAFEKKGHEVFSVEWDKSHDNIDLYKDISTLTAQEIIEKFGYPDVVWASPDCFTAGTLVWTSEGYKNIEDVKCNDLVLTHKGNYKKVYRTIKKNTYKFNKVKISGCEELLVTPNHPFYARKKHRVNTHKNGEAVVYAELLKPEWINAEGLTSEYKVGIPINSKSEIPKWNGVVKVISNSYGVNNSYIENTLDKYMANEDFWWIIGRYIGDGCVSTEKGMVEICCAKDENEEILEHLDRLDLIYSFREKRTTNAFIFSSKELCLFVEQFGKGALNKTITPEILNLPKDLLKSFLDGYISADGHWDYNSSNPSCSITTISKKLAYGLQQCILKAYGRYGSMTVRENPNNIIEGRVVNVHKAYIVSFYKEYNKRSQYTIEDNMAWVNVRKNELINTEQQSIYTLSVEDDESYTANNISVHNCTTFSVAGISHHRRKNKETGNLDPISEYAKFCDKCDAHVIELIKELNPKFYFIENPRGGMRKMWWMQDLPRYTVTYCKYGDTRQKPTDIWTNHPNPNFKPPCKPGSPCHEAAPRGSRTGTQGIKGAQNRSLIPEELCDHIVEICEEYVYE